MQQKDEKTLYLSKVIGQVINELRLKKAKGSINKFAHEYDLDVGNTSRIENGLVETKVVTLWKIAEAFEMKLSELVVYIEENISQDFHFFEE